MCYHRPLPQSQGCEPAEHLSWYRAASSVCLRFIKTCRLSGNLHLTPLIQKTDVVLDGLYKFWSSDKTSLFPGWCVFQSWCCWRLRRAFKLYISYRCFEMKKKRIALEIEMFCSRWSVPAVVLKIFCSSHAALEKLQHVLKSKNKAALLPTGHNSTGNRSRRSTYAFCDHDVSLTFDSTNQLWWSCTSPLTTVTILAILTVLIQWYRSWTRPSFSQLWPFSSAPL